MNGRRSASNVSCPWIQMKETALANEPDVATAVLDDVCDSPDELTVAVIAVMRERFRRRVEPVQAGFRWYRTTDGRDCR